MPTTSNPDDMVEACEACGRETPHTVTIQIVAESTNPQPPEYSREPYRVSECCVCGHERVQRMNHL